MSSRLQPVDRRPSASRVPVAGVLTLSLAGGLIAASLVAAPAPDNLRLTADRLPNFEASAADTDEYTKDDALIWRREHGQKYRRAVRSTRLSGEERRELEIGLAHHRRMFTLPSAAPNIPEVAGDVTKDIDQFAEGQAKEVMLEVYATELLTLLYHKELLVRINAIHTLGALNQEPGAAIGGSPPKPYWQTYRALLSVIEDPNRTAAEKVRAADGLARIVRYSDIPRRDRDVIIKRASAEMAVAADPANWPERPSERKDYWFWPYKLAAMLGSLDAPMTLNREPLPVAALAEVAADRRQHWRVRTQALRSISELRLEDEGRFNLAAVARLTNAVAAEMVEAYNRDPTPSYWRRAFFDVYFAFKPPTQTQFERGEGLLAKVGINTFRGDAAAVEAAFGPLEAVMVEFSPIPPGKATKISDGAVTALKTFAAENPPSDPIHPDIAVVSLAQSE